MGNLHKGNYWRYKAEFYIEARNMDEFNEKHKRMKAIAEEVEWQ